MGRFLKRPLSVPPETEVKVESGWIHAKGSQGENSFRLPKGVKVNFNDGILVFDLLSKEYNQSLVGLSYRKVENVIQGVNKKFIKELEINGVGYRWNLTGKNLKLQLGFSHDVSYDIPDEIEVVIKDNVLTIMGVDKQKVGEVAANIKKLRPIEPYKGKGIKYVGQYVVRKQGKAGSSK